MMADKIDRLIAEIDECKEMTIQRSELNFKNLKSGMIEWMRDRFCAFPLEMG